MNNQGMGRGLWRIGLLAAVVWGMAGVVLPVRAATLFVAANGKSTGTGAENSPLNWRTALSRAAAGDTIVFKPGLYTQTALGTVGAGSALSVNKSGTALAPLVIKAQYTATDPANRDKRTIIQPEANNVWQGFIAYGQEYIELRGFEFDGSLAGDHSPDASGTQVWTDGVVMQAAHHITVADNIIHDFPGGGAISFPIRDANKVAIAFSDYLAITGNVIYNNCFWSKYQPSGISLLQSEARPTGDTAFHNFVRGNIVYGNASKFTGVSKQGDLHHTDGNGIIIDTLGTDCPYTLVENNVSYLNGGRGIHVFNSDNVLVRNNTTYHNTQDTDIAVGGELTARGKNVLFVNNIAVSAGTRPINNVSSPPGGSSTVTFAYNLYSNVPVGYTLIKGTGDVTVADPQFVNVAAFDFHCVLTSPAVDTGTLTNYAPNDLEGRARPLGRSVDRGAYEIGRKPKSAIN